MVDDRDVGKLFAYGGEDFLFVFRKQEKFTGTRP
jgi:hypothetical protein